MHHIKCPLAPMMLLLSILLAAPAALGHPQVIQALATPVVAANLPDPTDIIPDFSTPANDPQPATFTPGDSVDLCRESSFENQDSSASPLISDCLQIATNIAEGGQWSVTSGAQHQLVQFGTCAFGVQGCCGDAFFYVGNQDIIDIIHDSIARFGSNGIVGAKGQMKCTGAAIPPTVSWGLYHT